MGDIVNQRVQFETKSLTEAERERTREREKEREREREREERGERERELEATELSYTLACTYLYTLGVQAFALRERVLMPEEMVSMAPPFRPPLPSSLHKWVWQWVSAWKRAGLEVMLSSSWFS